MILPLLSVASAILSAGVARAQTVAPATGQPAQPPVVQTPEQAAAAWTERQRQWERERSAREARRARAVAAADRALERWTADALTPFQDEADFNAYLAAVRRREAAEWAAAQPSRVQFAGLAASGQQADASTVPVCPPTDKECLNQRDEAESGEAVVVTGSRIVTTPLTNNQEPGVDEGDVVKQIGQYLLVLQDGRVFVIDTEAGEQRNELRLADRADVYRSPEEEAWYDELVVEGNRIVVAGYAYEAAASELAIFRLGEDGRLTRGGVFQISSEDYYDRNNYASRLIGDELVLYIPIAHQDQGDAFRWPTLRRAPMPGARRDQPDGTRLLRPDQLYRPLSTLSEPVIHLVTRCRLGDHRPGADLGCSSQGFVASRSRQFYVAGAHAYLWSVADDSERWDEELPFCAVGFRPIRREAARSILHRVSLSGGPMAVVGTVGAPFDQLGMDASEGRFRALTSWWSRRCQLQKDNPLVYFEIGEAAFGTRLRPAPDSAFTPLPAIGAPGIENRFTDRFLVYGGRSGFGRLYVGGDEDEGTDGTNGAGDAVVVPIGRPRNAVRVPLRHRVWRVERAGDNAVLTGYDDASGLDVSVIDLRGAVPRLADTVRLEGRYESEGRSHAFNSLIAPDGSGRMGLPTVLRVAESDRRSWRSAASDVSFLTVSVNGRLQSLGALESRAEERRYHDRDNAPADPEVYSCEVSCIDWYGNSRPLFTRGRVFALTGTELVEGRVADGRITEVRRIDLTKELPQHLRRAD